MAQIVAQSPNGSVTEPLALAGRRRKRLAFHRAPTYGRLVGKVFERLDDRWRRFIAAQPLYFVATAPSGPDGHVNVSPKGYADTFAVLDDTTVAYLDLDGSGVETIAHLRQNGRVTIMFCSFGRTAKILRLYGQGSVVVPAAPRRQGHRPPRQHRPDPRPGPPRDRPRQRVFVACEWYWSS